MKKLFPILIFLLFVRIVCAQPFVFVDTPFDDVMQSSIGIMDYNMDGRMDVFVAGQIYSGNELLPKSTLYQNKASNKWEKINSGISPLSFPVQDWADINADNKPDLLISGINEKNVAVCKIYMNKGSGKFSEMKTHLPAVTDGSVQWGDYDNDGLQDILLCGKTTDNILISKIFRNRGNSFEDIEAALLPVHKGTAKWADFDGDGNLDVLLLGITYNNKYTGKIYFNKKGHFDESPVDIPGLKHAAAVCADLNGDELIDFVIAGENSDGVLVSKMYKNSGAGSFAPTDSKLTGVRTGNIDEADFDMDGDTDIVLCGESDAGAVCHIYENKGGFNFGKIFSGIPGVSLGEARWFDYDGDQDQDLLISGLNNCFDFMTKLYRNDAEYNTDNDDLAGKNQQAAGSARQMWNTSELRLPAKKYYYFVYASCYCDPFSEGEKATHAFISNVHYAPEQFSLIENFNRIIRENSKVWASIDKGNRVSTGYLTLEEALNGRQRVLNEYKKEGFTVHFVEW